MKKSLRTFLAFMLLITALQLNAELVIKGVVIDNQGNPIEYANFGIVEEYFFDVTDESGYFTFAFPDSIGMNHTMRFRHMSFIPLDVNLSDMSLTEINTIVLDPQFRSLPDVVVYANRQKLKNIVSKGLYLGGQGQVGVNTDRSDMIIGGEFGKKFSIKKKIQVNDVEISLASPNLDSCLVRINIYTIHKGDSATIYNPKPIYRVLYLNKNVTQYTYSLIDDELILIPGDYYIAFELVDNYKKGFMQFPLYMGRGYIRSSNLVEFGKFPFSFGISMNGYLLKS